MLLQRPGWCPAHAHLAAPARAERHRIYDETQRDPVAKKFYNSAAWRKLRKLKLAQNPVCEQCQRRLAREVDHVKPRAQHPELALDITNLQSLCTPCHSRKTIRETAEKRRVS